MDQIDGEGEADIVGNGSLVSDENKDDSVSIVLLDMPSSTEGVFPSREVKSLEQIAKQLERSLPVRSNSYRFRVYKGTFVGSECVDYLVRSNLVSSRADAVILGRRLAKEFNLFEHVTLEHELKDDFFFYRFTDAARRINPALETGEEVILRRTEDLAVIANIVREHVDVRDRTYRLKKYNDVFVASQVVTFMVEENLAQSREEAVELGRRLQNELNLWYHVCHEHNFKDDYLFYRFTTATDQLMTSVIGLVSNSGSDQSNPPVSHSVKEMTLNQLHNIAEQLRRGLRVKDRMYHFQAYRGCFVASEAVDFMVEGKLARTREEAVDLGRRLAKEFHLWYHVTNDHEFSDKYLFYRFALATDQKSSIGSSGRGSAHEPEREDFGIDVSGRSDSDTYSEHSLSLIEIASRMTRGVMVKDRMYKFRTYKSCFVGCEAIDFMVQARIASSREEAVQLGRRLEEERQLFHHVTREQPFKDDYLFYRFSTAGDDDSSSSSMKDFDDGDSKSDDLSIHALSSDELAAVGEQLRRGVRVKNRQYRLKTYKNCFIGSEAVDYLVQSGLVCSRANAVEIGRRLTVELDFFHHVTDDHQFDDAYLFFRFNTLDQVKATASDWNGGNGSIENSLNGGIYRDATFRMERLQFERNMSLRKEEQARLKAMRRAMASCQQPPVVLIAGPSGCGKSSLVLNTLAEDPTILFCSAKFDQRSHLSPLQTLRLLFTDICKRMCASEDIGEFQRVLKESFAAVHIQKQVLVSWIPEVGALFTQIPERKGFKRRSENVNLLQLSMEAFLQAVTTVKPLIVCLDDIMWSDPHTLEILHFILTKNIPNFMFCATFRDNEVDEKHPLFAWQSQIEEQVFIETIQLNTLTISEIQEFLSKCLKRDEEELLNLAELLLERTHGNMFFLIKSLENLQDLLLVTYDFVSLRWNFSVDEIRKKTRVADNVGELLSKRIEQLPRDVQQVLKLGSCFGSAFDPETLEHTKSILFIFGDIYHCLQSACEEELLIRVSDRQYVFAHDNVQSTAYQLLPEGSERRRIHWDIGLKLLKKRNVDFDSDWYFSIADQMKLSEEVMYETTRHEDRSRIAMIFCKAGEKAAEISAFLPAANYFAHGVAILGSDASTAFSKNYKLATKLFSSYAKALLSAGDAGRSRKISESIVLASRTAEDKLSGKLAIFHCLSVESNLDDQIDFGLHLLEESGLKIPKYPNRVQVSLEYERAMLVLRGYNDHELLSLPPMSEKNIEFSIDLLCTLLESGQSLKRSNFICYTLAKLVQLTLRHGVCIFTPLIFVLVGQDCIGRFNDLKGGHRFVQVGLRFHQTLEAANEGSGRLLAHACMAVGCVQPLSKSMYLALDAYKAGIAEGDMGSAFHGASVYLWSFFYSGLPFKPLLEDVEKFAMQMLEYKQTRLFVQTTPIFQVLLCLSGQEDDNSDITMGRAIAMNKEVKLEGLFDEGGERLQSYGMQLAVYMQDEEKAAEYYELLKEENSALEKASTAYHVRLFFFGLICIQNYRHSRKFWFRNEAKRYIDTLRELVNGGGINLPHKVLLLEAEFASLSPKDTSEVIRTYEKSSFAASRAGFLQDGALSNQLCADFCLREGKEDSAGTYLRQAHSLYTSWGAVAVADRIKQKHSHLFPEAENHPQSPGTSFRSRPHFRPSLALMHKSLSRARGLAVESGSNRRQTKFPDPDLRTTL